MSEDYTLSRLEAVNLRLARLGVREADLTEQFIRSGGKGGQNVNKVATAVRLTYRPTGLDVKCMEERTQLLNRVRAREIMADRIEQKRESSKLAQQAQAAKARREKAGRPRSIKRQILKDKRIKSAKKKNRTWKGNNDFD